MLTRHRPSRRSEDGFTLIELVISIAIFGIVFGALSMVMVGAMTANRDTKVRLDETRDEQFVAAYFASDVSGATKMSSGQTTVCGTGLAVAEFRGTSFNDVTLQATDTVVSYVLTTGMASGINTGTLTRFECESVAASPSVLISTTVVARSLAPATPVVHCYIGAVEATCALATTPAPATMTVSFDRRSGGAPFVLSGARRTTP
ncbi:PulJ/GspJ family protein [Pengzhenrongella sp.]|jgi:prepilin-type N-terminal cleavage/methylation domain-containing protein|uniref:PulJ/GspJ family protein n=1 Tax=Pengzhenrongella sp. TaxID=2888820 RepID=UPI002F9399DB